MRYCAALLTCAFLTSFAAPARKGAVHRIKVHRLAHTFEIDPGTHTSGAAERVEKNMLPFVSTHPASAKMKTTSAK